jgi:hypothetical protein
MVRFVRLRTNLRGTDSAMPLGLFYALAELAESHQMDPWSMERAEEICCWFNKHLPVPRLELVLKPAVFWLRGECCGMIQRLWELAIVLEEYAVVELVHTTRPGWVRYEDEFQVAAIPTRR